MTDNTDKINLLLEKLEILLKRQREFSNEINDLQIEISQLKASQMNSAVQKDYFNKHTISKAAGISAERGVRDPAHEIPGKKASAVTKRPKMKTDLEKFIGENLISKIGIVVTVIGVAIGAKYTIDHELISPLTRIILGYLFGGVLLAFAIRLKKNYTGFSAVLLSGSMAIMYFITFAAYTFYNLISQTSAFAMMVIFTVFTVAAAINYNKRVIAHIGLAGAYAVPFLLSDGSGKIAVLFIYMTIINLGILAIAVKKYWKSLYYLSFVLTWLIYLSWYVFRYAAGQHFALAFTFLSVFFFIFYLTFLAYKLVQNEKFEVQDIILLLANAFVFYGNGYALFNEPGTGRTLLGSFTLLNAVIHFIVSVMISRRKLADKNLFYLVAGLVLIFITIAIPVQLDGNWVTLLWAGEAALLFWIGRTKNVAACEQLSYPLMLLAFVSLVHDWMTISGFYDPLLNINFLSSLLFIAAFAFINKVQHDKKYTQVSTAKRRIAEVMNWCIPAILVFTLYNSFRIEIANYWDQRYIDSVMATGNIANGASVNYTRNEDLNRFKIIWIINYSLLFVAGLVFMNYIKIKNKKLEAVSLGLIILVLVVFLGEGLYVLSGLRESYLQKIPLLYGQSGIFNIGVRYISIAAALLALFAGSRYVARDVAHRNVSAGFDIFLHITVIWILSSELINWMDIGGWSQSHKLGLSILWGVYSLFLISLGIWKQKKHLRIGAIVLFGITLVKLFFYDLAHLGTIDKTIVLVSLGVLLLSISFLYNKYKNVISGSIEN